MGKNIHTGMYKLTPVGNVIFYASGVTVYLADHGMKKMSGLLGDHKIENLKFKEYGGWSSKATKLGKQAIIKLRAVGIYTLAQLVTAYRYDHEGTLDRAASGQCARSRAWLAVILSVIVKGAPLVADPNFVAPTVIPLGFSEIMLRKDELPSHLNLKDLSADELKDLQANIKQAIEKVALPLVFDAIVKIRQAQFDKAKADLDNLTEFANAKVVDGLFEMLTAHDPFQGD